MLFYGKGDRTSSRRTYITVRRDKPPTVNIRTVSTVNIGKPVRLRASVLTSKALTLTWSCENVELEGNWVCLVGRVNVLMVRCIAEIKVGANVRVIRLRFGLGLGLILEYVRVLDLKLLTLLLCVCVCLTACLSVCVSVWRCLRNCSVCCSLSSFLTSFALFFQLCRTCFPSDMCGCSFFI